MIEARLTEDGREPLHTQVVLQDVVRGFRISLRDESGVFLEVEPPEREDSLPPEDSFGGEDGSESDTVAELQAEVTLLRPI